MQRTLGETRYTLTPVIRQLIAERLVVEGPTPPGQPAFATSYRLVTETERARLPPVRTIEVPTFDAVALRQKIESVLASGASYDLAEVVRSCSIKLPYATKDTVLPQIEALIAAGRVVKIPVGSFTRYRTAIQEDGAKSA